MTALTFLLALAMNISLPDNLSDVHLIAFGTGALISIYIAPVLMSWLSNHKTNMSSEISPVMHFIIIVGTASLTALAISGLTLLLALGAHILKVRHRNSFSIAQLTVKLLGTVLFMLLPSLVLSSRPLNYKTNMSSPVITSPSDSSTISPVREPPAWRRLDYVIGTRACGAVFLENVTCVE